MKKWQLVSLLSIFFLFLIFIAQKSNNVPVLSDTMQPSQSPHINDKYDVVTSTVIPVSDVDTSIIKETWFAELSDSDRMTISTLDDGMQRMYKPTDRLFFNDSNALLEFFYRNVPNISQPKL